MTDDTSETLFDRIADSRRDFLKKGALASGGLLLGASGTAAAQQDDDGILDEGWQALIFISNFHPNGRFVFVSDVVDWPPNYGDVQDSFFGKLPHSTPSALRASVLEGGALMWTLDNQSPATGR